MRKYENLILVFIFIALNYSYLSSHVNYAYEKYSLNDDSRINFAFLNYYGHKQFEDDYIAKYVRDAKGTPIWKFHFWLGDKIGLDVNEMTKLGGVVLWFLSIATIVLCAWQLYKNKYICWAVLMFAIASWIFPGKIIGGFARSYGFFVSALFLFYLIKGRPIAMGIVTIFGALSYPVIAFMGGISLFCYYMLLPKKFQDEKTAKSPFIRKFLTLSIFGVLTILAVLPQIIGGQDYGRRISHITDIEEFPEAGPGGRHMDINLPQSYNLFFSTINYIKYGLTSASEDPNIHILGYIVTILILIATIYYSYKNFRKIIDDTNSIRLLLYFLVSCFSYILASIFSPYLYEPDRYTGYVISILAIILFCRIAWQELEQNKKQKIIYITLITAFILVFSGTRDGIGYSIKVEEQDRAKYEFIENQLDDSSVITGITQKEDIINIPYLTKRRILIAKEFHYVYHYEYMLEMRERFTDLINAVFSDSFENSLKLKNKYGVTHIIFEKSHCKGQVPKYFIPFSEMIARKYISNENNLYYCSDEVKDAVVFEDKKFWLFDLGKLENEKNNLQTKDN
jgi:uncharacterized membrane protein